MQNASEILIKRGCNLQKFRSKMIDRGYIGIEISIFYFIFLILEYSSSKIKLELFNVGTLLFDRQCATESHSHSMTVYGHSYI